MIYIPTLVILILWYAVRWFGGLTPRDTPACPEEYSFHDVCGMWAVLAVNDISKKPHLAGYNT